MHHLFIYKRAKIEIIQHLPHLFALIQILHYHGGSVGILTCYPIYAKYVNAKYKFQITSEEESGTRRLEFMHKSSVFQLCYLCRYDDISMLLRLGKIIIFLSAGLV